MINKKRFSFMLITAFSLTIIPGKMVAMEQKKKEEEAAECIICCDPLVGDEENIITLHCHETHKFHKVCLAGWTRGKYYPNCPLCKKNLTQADKNKLGDAENKAQEIAQQKARLRENLQRLFRRKNNDVVQIEEDIENIFDNEITEEAINRIKQRLQNLENEIKRGLPQNLTEDEKLEMNNRISAWLVTEYTKLEELERLKAPTSPESANPQNSGESEQEEPEECASCGERLPDNDKVEHEGCKFHGACLRDQLAEIAKRSENPEPGSQPERPECTLCDRRIMDDVNIQATICNHQFHINCLENHLTRNGNECPTCENEAISEGAYNQLLIKKATEAEKPNIDLITNQKRKADRKRLEEERKRKRLERESKKREEALKKQLEEIKAKQKHGNGDGEEKRKVEKERKKLEAERKHLVAERKRLEKEKQKRARKRTNDPLRSFNNGMRRSDGNGGNNGGNGNNGGWFWPITTISASTACLLIGIIFIRQLLK